LVAQAGPGPAISFFLEVIPSKRCPPYRKMEGPGRPVRFCRARVEEAPKDRVTLSRSWPDRRRATEFQVSVRMRLAE